MKLIGLADCNNFYVSCERVFNPSLCGKPVVVLSNNDGCVISRSNEVKALGVKMGQPLFEIKELIHKHDIKVYSTNFTLYGDMSARVMETLKSFVPSTEVYSIDEAFLDFTGINEELIPDLGRTLAYTVRKHTGIPVSIGISKTKTLAKIASKLCKKYPKLQNSCFMYDDRDINKVLKTFPINDVWGIGRRYAKMLNENGVSTALEFTNLSPDWVRKKMSIVGLKTWKELRGESCVEFAEIIEDKQQICTSRSFASNIGDLEELCKSVAYFASSCAEKLRKQRSVCGSLTVFILTNFHRADMPQHHQSIVIPLENHTDSTIELIRHACSGLLKIYRKGYLYKKAGVILSDITPKAETPASLFCETDTIKHDKIMKVMDEINMSYGRASIVTAAQGVDRFKANQEHLSAKYTTDWNDILKVKV